MRILALLSIGFFFAGACRHIPDFSPLDCTLDHTTPAYNLDTLFTPIEPCGAVTQYVNPDRYAFYDACFNPNNNSQIAFIRHDLSTFPWTIELCTFDFCTNEFKVLTDRCFISPDWSTKNWITFRGKDKQIWIIKSNSDSLTQLTFDARNHGTPRWETNGQKILFWEDNMPLNHHVIIDLSGKRLDTIPGLISPSCDWDGEKIITHRGQNNNQFIFLTNYSNLSSTIIDSVYLNPTTYDSSLYTIDLCSVNKTVYWTFPRQINATSFNGRRHAIAKTINNNWYGRVSVSGDGTKLLVERTDRRRTDFCVIEEHNRLYLMEADGSNERRIVFPE
jgi:hypothetical protein